MEITKIHHDAAMVFAKRPFILVILAHGPAEKKYSAPLMAEVARSFTKRWNRDRTQPDKDFGTSDVAVSGIVGPGSIAIHVKLSENRIDEGDCEGL